VQWFNGIFKPGDLTLQDITLAFLINSFSNSKSPAYPAEFSISLTKGSFKLTAFAGSIQSNYMYEHYIKASIPYCYIDSIYTIVTYTYSVWGVKTMTRVFAQEVIHNPDQILSDIHPMLCAFLNAHYEDIAGEETITRRVDF
jgi:hypothetical protein